jgi:zinc/manganese transport system substrate-binding protein
MMKQSFKRLVGACTCALGFGMPLAIHANLNLVATLPDFAAIAHEIGGDQVQVASICRGTEDPHFVDGKPSFIRLLNRADLLLEGGAELEIGWLGPLVNNARNPKILGDVAGHVVLSRGVPLLDVPSGPVDRSMGDVHPLGNPHYWLDPANGKILATNIARALEVLDPAHAADFQARLQKFSEKLDARLETWTQLMAPYRGLKMVTYHSSFAYFARRFGLVVAATIEPKPGIEPSPGHVNALVQSMKATGIKLILQEPFRPHKTSDYLAQATGARVVLVPAMVGGNESIRDYFQLFDYAINQIVTALKAAP